MPGVVETIEIEVPLYRMVPSRFPPVNLFEWAAGPEFEALAALESDTNDRLLNDAGALALVPLGERIFGPGSTPVMAAFTHIGHDNRFNDASIGAYYAALSKQTAIAETRFHRQRFMSASNDPPGSVQMRCYSNDMASEVSLESLCAADFRGFFGASTQYAASQAYAAERRGTGTAGFYYPSVRDTGGRCVVAFRPNALTAAVQCGHYEYFWNGHEIEQVFEMLSQPLS
ncbi:RES family NAD+ phosphorylase [Reinekea sp.]|jgi:hypothetical protein|uniref:RES family NAD+ phosphorylase n=1 Tax=Reinekea sp. TaxID=1970455 RepID=UPI002A83E298|nr:RES family NAD+ phosphorylase [Reinekea sp.]